MPRTPRAHPRPPTPAQEQLSKTSKGLRSRIAILDAALVCIAKFGLSGVTHRAIAAQAGVPHSLTTYFFKSLQDLLEQAFERFVALASEDNLAIMKRAEAYLDTLDPAQRFVPSRRRDVLANLADMLTDFVLREAAEHSVGIAVELNALYIYRSDGRMRELALGYRDMLVTRIAELIRKLAPEREADAMTDASIVLAVMHKLELDCMNEAASPPRARVHREITRLLTMMFAVSEVAQSTARAA